MVRKNLQNAFPHHSENELQIIEKQFYKHFCDLIFETLKINGMSVKEIQKRVQFKNPEVFEKYLQQQKNLICCSGHVGNWEWATLAFGTHIFPANYTELNVYKKLTNKTMDDFMNQTRARFGAVNVEKKLTLRALAQRKNENYCLILAADQSPAWDELHYFTTFLHQSTPIYLGVEKIAKIIQTPILFFETKRLKRGYYQVTCHELFEQVADTQPYEITNKHVQFLEKIIEKNPYNWLWSHNRWKHKPTHS